MKHLITKATIYYNEGSEQKSVIYPNTTVDDIESYRKELGSLIACNRIIIDSSEV